MMKRRVLAVWVVGALVAGGQAHADCLMEAASLVDRMELLQVERLNRRQLLEMLTVYKNSPASHIRERAQVFESFLKETPYPKASTLPFHAALCEALTPAGVSSLLQALAQSRTEMFFNKLKVSLETPLDTSAYSPSRRESIEILTDLFALPPSLDERFQALHRQAVEWVYPRAVETTKVQPFADFTEQEISAATEHFTDAGLLAFTQWMDSDVWRRLFEFMAKRRLDNLQALTTKAQAALESPLLLQEKALGACAEHLKTAAVDRTFWKEYARVCNELFVYPGMHERLSAWTVVKQPRDRWNQLVLSMQARLCFGDLRSKQQEAFCAYNPLKPKLSEKRIKETTRAFFKQHFEEEHGAELAQTLDAAFWSRFDSLFSVRS